MVPRPLLLFLAVLIASPLFAAFAATDSFVTVAGRSTGAGGRQFETMLWLTNTTGESTDVTISFLRGEQPNPTPHAFSLRLGPHELRAMRVGSEIIGTPEGLGALHVTSTKDVAAEVRVLSLVAGDASRTHATTQRAIPSQFAIGSGETTSVQGVSPSAGRAKFYVVETTGLPLYFTATLRDHSGRGLGQKRWLINGREQRAWDVPSEFPNLPAGGARLEIHGVNGSGKIIAAVVVTIPESQDVTTFEMSLPAQPRHRLGVAEIAAYAIAALALIAAAVSSRA